jgi:hypothetical protein
VVLVTQAVDLHPFRDAISFVGQASISEPTIWNWKRFWQGPGARKSGDHSRQ